MKQTIGLCSPRQLAHTALVVVMVAVLIAAIHKPFCVVWLSRNNGVERDAIRPISVVEAAKMEAIFVDARASHQFRETHIRGAINIQPNEPIPLDLPSGRMVIVYCGEGACLPAVTVAQKLRKTGRRVAVLYGNWRNGALPLSP